MNRVRLFACSLAAVGMLLAFASPAFSQRPGAAGRALASTSAPASAAAAGSPASTASPAASSTAKPSAYQQANWTKYLAFVLAGIAVLVVGMAALGWLIQAPGFRTTDEEAE